MRINVLFRSGDSKIPVRFKEDKNRLNVKFKNVYKVSVIDAGIVYDGPYVVDPSQEVQILPTKQKFLRKDITVNEVLMGLATTTQIDRLF